MVKRLMLLVPVGALIAGCAAPDYVSHAPITIQEGLPMNQPDTLNRISSIASNLIVSLSSVEASAAEYLSTHDWTDESGSSLIPGLKSALSDAIETVEYNQDVANGFKPAASMEGKLADMKSVIESVRTAAKGMQKALKEKDDSSFSSNYEKLQAGLSDLKALSTGMQ